MDLEVSSITNSDPEEARKTDGDQEEASRT